MGVLNGILYLHLVLFGRVETVAGRWLPVKAVCDALDRDWWWRSGSIFH